MSADAGSTDPLLSVSGLAVAIAFIHKRPEYFAHVLGELLFWLGSDKICFGSDYAIWSPKWITEQFANFALPESVAREKGVSFGVEDKRKILGLNMARLYDIDIDAKKRCCAPAPSRGQPQMAAE